MTHKKKNPAAVATAVGAKENASPDASGNNNTLAPRSVQLAAALAYAKQGWVVFPAKFVGKQKLGHTSAEKSNGNPWGYTNNPNEIRAYWRQWPHAAIGLPTGAVNGLFVLDLDTQAGGHEYDGEGSLQKLMQRHVALPITRGVKTPTGGLHLYYAQPPGVTIPCSASKLGPGIDVRGDGGFVIAPPSMRPRVGPYTWQTTIGTNRIKRAPKWLLDLVVATPRMQAMEEADAGKGLSTDAADNHLPDDVEAKVAAALTVIPADLDYANWYRAGCAIYAGLGDSGFALFDEWSREAPHKYPRNGCAAKWRECAKVSALGVETLYWMADQYDPDWRDTYKRLRQRRAVSC